jgi:hypothetical protein
MANLSRRPLLLSTARNHSADTAAPPPTTATVRAVEAIRNPAIGSVPASTAKPAARAAKTAAPQPGVPLEEAVQSGVAHAAMAQRRDLRREPGDQRMIRPGGAREQHRQGELGYRELQQVDPGLAGRQHERGLRAQQQRGDHQQARHLAGGQLAYGQHEPDRHQPGEDARCPARHGIHTQVGSERYPRRLSYAPAGRPQQPPRPGDLDALDHRRSIRRPASRSGISFRSVADLADRAPFALLRWLGTCTRSGTCTSSHDIFSQRRCGAGAHPGQPHVGGSA